MNKLKILMLGGLMIALAWPSFASNGNPRIPTATPGSGAALVFCGAVPGQDDAATSGALNLLATPANYFIDTAAYPSYTKYGVTSTPVVAGAGYLLLKDGATKYAVVGFGLGSPVGPADEKIDSVTWYKTGKPTAPSNIVVTAGYETAKLSWQLDPNYNYSSVDLIIERNAGGIWTPVQASGGITTTTLGGAATSYIAGEYVDGRLLNSGDSCRVILVAKVYKKADHLTTYDSDPASKDFSMKSGGSGGPVNLSLQFVSTAGLGVNSFSVPNATCAVSNAAKDGVPATPTITSVASGLDLVKLINEINSGPMVRTLGIWDEVNQIEKGVVVNYVGSAIDPTSVTDLGTAFPTLKSGTGYQVFIKPDSASSTKIDFTLQ